MLEWIAKYWMQVVFGAVAGLFASLYAKAAKRIKGDRTQNDAMCNGLKALLRDRIVQMYHLYMEKGSCPIHAADSLNLMYKEYKRLGGNSTVRYIVKEVSNLPKTKP